MDEVSWCFGPLRVTARPEVHFVCESAPSTKRKSVPASIVRSTQSGRPNRGAAQLIALALLRLPSAFADVLGNMANGDQWAGYGRTYDELHYSPLVDINVSNVSQLGLAWWFDIPGVVLATSTPLEVDGRLYFATGYSVVRAVDATNGRLLWVYDPEVPKVAGHKLRVLWGIRGIAFWNDRIYVGTHDGRLICIDAATGKAVWSVATTEPDDLRIITGPPLVFKGKVMIGQGGSEFGPLRGYVTTYDARTGKQLWRFSLYPVIPKRVSRIRPWRWLQKPGAVSGRTMLGEEPYGTL